MAIASGSFIIRKQKNLPPVALDDAYATNMGVPLSVIPVSNDFDQDSIPLGSSLTVYSYDTSSLNSGTITLSSDKKSMFYTPATNFFGMDSFTYQITDGLGGSNTATVKLSVVCLPPIITPKSYNLLANTTYVLDIRNPTAVTEIVFAGGLPDRDVNVPEQTISIVPGSITHSTNLLVNASTNTTITFTTCALGAGVSFALLFVAYEISNSVCGLSSGSKPSVTTPTITPPPPPTPSPGGGGGGGGGTIRTTTARVVNGFLGQRTLESNVPKTFTKYPQFDSATGDYPWDNEGWFVFCCDTQSVPDQYYISTISKPYLDTTTGTWTTDRNFYGLIGPVGDSLGSTLDGNGRFLFYKPKGRDLNIWGATDQNGSVFSIGCVQLYRLSATDVNDPNRYFNDPTARPPTNLVLDCLNNVGIHPFNATVNDYTDTFTGTTQPPFITVI